MKKKLYYTKDTYYCKVNDITGFTPLRISELDNLFIKKVNIKVTWK